MNTQDLLNRVRQSRSFGPQPTVSAITNSQQLGSVASALGSFGGTMPTATVPKQFTGGMTPLSGAYSYGNDMVLNGAPVQGIGGTAGPTPVNTIPNSGPARNYTGTQPAWGTTPQGIPWVTAGGYPVQSQGGSPASYVPGTTGGYPGPDTRQGPMPNPMQGGLSKIFQNRQNLWQAGGPVRQKVSNANVGQGGQPLFGQNQLSQVYSQPSGGSSGGSDPYAQYSQYPRQGDWVQLPNPSYLPGYEGGATTQQLVWYNPKTGETSSSPPSTLVDNTIPGDIFGGSPPTSYMPLEDQPIWDTAVPLGPAYDQGPVVNGHPPSQSLSKMYML